MTELDNNAYYTARAAKERESAETAQDPAVAAIHRQMAATYEKLAQGTTAAERMPAWVGSD
ncbi:MAG: hypothetical protein EOO82_00210 [Oxalobacteraceae bacterium]|nr:MAG: hypothetical protein EOO82_00210 [Oxalobacteraceae bacterium]